MDRAPFVLQKLWVGLVALMLCASAGAAKVDLSVSVPYGAFYVPEAWIPLRIEATNTSSQLVDGTVRVTPANPEVAEFRSPMRIPGQSKARATVWARFPVDNGKTPNVIGVTLHDAQGARLQISEINGRSAVTSISHPPGGLANSGYIVNLVGSEARMAESQQPDQIAVAIEAEMNCRAVMTTLDQGDAAQGSPLYDGAYLVMLTGLDPRSIDSAQRQALLDYVTAGGVLLLASPEPAQICGSWLEPYLPVRLIGKRQMNAVTPAGHGDSIGFGQWLPITEAMAGEGTILWQDEQFVHAAYRTLGLGRIVFTSFPAAALDGKNRTAIAFWQELLQLNRPPVGVEGTRITSEYGHLLEPMLGRKAASWKLAISAACLIVLVTMTVQLIWRGADRPRAFAVSLGTSVLLATGFAGMSLFRQQSEPLQHASVTMGDVTREGAIAQQYGAFAGPQQQLAEVAANQLTTICPVLLREERPAVSEWPMRLSPISIAPEQVKQVTLAHGMLSGVSGSVQGQFGQEGLRLDVNNGIGSELSSAQLTWGPYRLSAGTFPMGESSRTLRGTDLRPDQEFASVSGVASQDQLQKGEIVRALLQPKDVAPITISRNASLIGFVDTVPALTNVEGATVEHDAKQNLMRMRVELLPSPAGSPVRIDGCFNRIVPGELTGLPYIEARNEFLRSMLKGAWTLGIEPPTEIGAIEPRHVRVRISLASPQHKLTLRRGQCRDGKQKADREGPIVGQWDGKIGLQTVDFDPQPDDFDRQGRLWFMIDVQGAGAAGSLGVEPFWRIEQLQVDIDATVRQQ